MASGSPTSTMTCTRDMKRRLSRCSASWLKAAVRWSWGSARGGWHSLSPRAVSRSTALTHPRRWSPGFEAASVVWEAARHDPVSQRVFSQQVYLTEGGIRLFPLQVRYAWPSEMDLMAQLAGLRLRHRWAGWQREPFTGVGHKHVSVYE